MTTDFSIPQAVACRCAGRGCGDRRRVTPTRPLRATHAAVALVAALLGGCAVPPAGYGVAGPAYAPAEVGPGYYDAYGSNGVGYDPGLEAGRYRDDRYRYRPDYRSDHRPDDRPEYRPEYRPERPAGSGPRDFGERDNGGRGRPGGNGGREQPRGQPVPFIPNDARDGNLAGPNPGPRGQ